jgi:hypothetical protein
VSVADVEAALREKQAWILRKLHEQRDRAQRLQAAAKVDWRDGTGIPFLGETVILVLDARVTGAVLNTDAQALPGVPRLTLHLGLPHTAQPDQIRDTVQSWLQRQARRIFEERCAHFAPAPGRAHEAPEPEFGQHALGQRQCRRVDPPELAPGALWPAGDRLRGHARTGPPARDEPQPGVLGRGARGLARL